MLLQFITDTKSKYPVVEQIKAVVEGGCKWVTIKTGNASDDEIKKIVEEIKPLCLEKEVFLILEDHVELAKEVNVGGVELSTAATLSPSKARMILGPAAIVGTTVNSESAIDTLRSYDIDYFKIGPIQGQMSKPENEYNLDVNDIKKLCEYMENNDINIAHVAYGNIGLDDVDLLMSAGVNGIAISQAISEADNMTEETIKFIEKLQPYIKADEELKVE